MTENAFAPVIAAVLDAVRGKVQRAHDVAKAIKAAGATKADIAEWLNSSTDEEIVARREKLVKVLAKAAEEQKALEAIAEAAIKENAPEDIDSLKDEFKELKSEVRKSLVSAKTTLGTLGISDAPEIDEMLANLPSFTNLPGSGVSGKSPAEMEKRRAWARENGYEVGDRGRIKQEIHDAYDVAHGLKKAEDSAEDSAAE
jgi:hypothetical protein